MAKETIHLEYKEYDPDKTHLRKPEVMARTFLKSSTIYTGMKNGTFPMPVQLSRNIVVWREEDIFEFMVQRAIKKGSGVVKEVSSD